jgi:hypothetical protein
VSRHAVVLAPHNGDNGAVVVFASRESAERWRDAAEEQGVETIGLLPIAARVDAFLERR